MKGQTENYKGFSSFSLLKRKSKKLLMTILSVMYYDWQQCNRLYTTKISQRRVGRQLTSCRDIPFADVKLGRKEVSGDPPDYLLNLSHLTKEILFV